MHFWGSLIPSSSCPRPQSLEFISSSSRPFLRASLNKDRSRTTRPVPWTPDGRPKSRFISSIILTKPKTAVYKIKLWKTAERKLKNQFSIMKQLRHSQRDGKSVKYMNSYNHIKHEASNSRCVGAQLLWSLIYKILIVNFVKNSS